MKILIIQTAFIGDVILATPLIERLKESMPDCTVDFLLKKGNESVLAGHPHLHELIIYDKRKHKYRNLLKLIRKIRTNQYDRVININRFFTAGLMTILSGAAETTGFNKSPFSFLFTRVIPHHMVNFHEVYRNLSLLEGFSDTGFIRPRIYPSEADLKALEKPEPFICVAPATLWFTKQFPVNGWIELINRLPEKYPVYLLGSAGDADLCETIRSGTNRQQVINVAGKYTLLQSAALISKARVTFANDSTPVHLASAMNAPVVVIYCSTIPEFGFGPLSDNSMVMQVREKLPCRPCNLHGKKACPIGTFLCSHIPIDDLIRESVSRFGL